MHVIFVAPAFPQNQKEFVRALSQVGAQVTGIGEDPPEWLPHDVTQWLDGYEKVSSVTDEGALFDAVKRIQSRSWVDRLEATVEAHMLPVARVREACSIPGVTYEQTLICRDKTRMKEFMREHGIACAQSRSAESTEDVLEFINEVGYPIIMKPRDGAGAAVTWRIDREEDLPPALADTGVDRGVSIAVEEFVTGHEGFFDTLTVNGEIRHEFISHYYPNVLEAMRTRWISPVIIVTNRMDSEGYDEVKGMGHKIVTDLGLGTTPTHQEWFFGEKGLKFSEIGVRPPGVGHWDLYCAANEIDLYREWADAMVYGRTWGQLSRRYSAAIINLRPTQDGVIQRYEGLDRIMEKYNHWIIKGHIPSTGTPTQPVGAGYMANAWIHVRHPDYDDLREILREIGETVKVIAA
jgi:formate-dependent phosphoribosylglycinamide formyltransferase (GAR transformylase)